MKRLIAMALLIVGVALAAGNAARLGETYRQDRQEMAFRGMDFSKGPKDETPEEKELRLQKEAVAKPLRTSAEAWRETHPIPDSQLRLREWWEAAGFPWLLGIFSILIGAILARQDQQARALGEGAEGSSVSFDGNVEIILRTLEELDPKLQVLAMDDPATEIRAAIDRLQAEVIDPVVDQRAVYIARHGLETFAQYFGLFSAGERLLARTWSALTDGHAEVAREAFRESRGQFEEAKKAWLHADQK